MRSNIKFLSLLFMVLFSASSVAGFLDQDFSKMTLKTVKARNNIYMLEGQGGFAGGNVGVSAGEDGILIIDDLLSPMSDKVSASISKLSAGKLRFILNTHWHGDHTGGNANLSDHATIIAHTNVRKRLMTNQENSFGKTPAQPISAWPIVTFDKALTIHFNGEDIRFMHYPNGHTDGDGIIYFNRSNVAHLGDHFFAGTFPYVDLATGGNAFGLTKNVGDIITALPDDAIVIPGHGAISDMKGLKSYHEMLVATTSFVKDLAAQGETLEEIQLEGLPNKWIEWGGGFVNEQAWIALIFNSL
ncbi:MAG: MBL fold metallo-hydrolase [Cycloclasticus sp. symbiont of Poecilosclerida sp. M]|nr:MAG: MBL fold metallo-hydrolase [Cycloclasticus sp. symbiont of Poecilosclerida sp. M]